MLRQSEVLTTGHGKRSVWAVHGVGRVTSRTKGQVGYSAIKPRREPKVCKQATLPLHLPFAHCTWVSNSFVQCFSVCPALALSNACPLLCCHKPHSIRLRRFPKISLPHSQRSPPQRPLQALCPHSCSRNSGSGHGSENQHLLEPPIHCQRPTYLNPYRSVLLFPPHFHPSPTAGRSSHHRSTLTSLFFLKLACCVQSQHPLVAAYSTLDPSVGLSERHRRDRESIEKLKSSYTLGDDTCIHARGHSAGQLKMNSYALSPVGHDLDGLTFPTNQHGGPQVKRQYGFNQDFGFDPSLTEQNMVDPYSDTANKIANWGGFGNRNTSYQNPQEVLSKANSTHRHSLSLPQSQQLTNSSVGALPAGSLTLNTKSLHNPASTMSIYGQVTPPRSNSATSEPLKNLQDPASATTNHSTTKRRRTKADNKNPVTPSDDNNTPKQRKASGRKRANTTQVSTANQEDDRRKASLEKNRVAAAKCRINKKEKTEQLQRDSHTKAQENGQLRGLVETMEVERNTLAAYLNAHASCGDCRNPNQLKEALRIFQENEMRKRFPGLAGEAVTADTSPVLSVSGQSMDSALFDDVGFNSTTSALNPPLPDFNLGGDYDIHSPLPG
jgi:hypothetical protein